METGPDEITLFQTVIVGVSLYTSRVNDISDLHLTETSLVWKPRSQNGSTKTLHIPVNEIIGVHLCDHPCQFQVQYVVREPRFKWVKGEVSLMCQDNDKTCLWVTKIKQKLKDPRLSRPKILLVLINPASGANKGEVTYHKHVAPLFQLAGIETEVKVSKTPGQFKDFVDACDLNALDGIISVGGDGSFNELCQALLSRTAREEGINTNDSGLHLLQPTIRVGFIPGGTGNQMAYYTTGICDAVTCTLRIIVGDNIALDVCTIHQNEHLLSISTLLMIGYGFYGDMAAYCEQNRHLGILRIFSGLAKTVYNHRVFKAEVEYIPANNEDKNHLKSGTVGSAWKRLEGEFQTLCCWCTGTPRGRESILQSDRDLGVMGITLVHKCSRIAEFKHMIRVFRRTRPSNHGAFNLDYITSFDAKEFKIKIQTDDNNDMIHALTSDGEYIQLEHPPCFSIKVHQQKIKMFARGMEDFAKKLLPPD